MRGLCPFGRGLPFFNLVFRFFSDVLDYWIQHTALDDWVCT